MRNSVLAVLVLAVATSATEAGAVTIGDDFSTNPLTGGSGWSFGAGDNSHNQFTWSAGSLGVHIDSSLPTARLDRPLGQTLTDTASFALSARFSFTVTGAPDDGFAQFAFGLTNHLHTGSDRTGSPTTSANTYDAVEFDYFPNLSPQFGGHTLAPIVFGAAEPDGYLFGNFDYDQSDAAILSKHASGITELPQSTTLEAHLNYDGSTKQLTLDMYQVVGTSLVLLDTGSVPLNLASDPTYDPTLPFQVDTLSIMAYRDGWTGDPPSLVADVNYSSISLTVVPEPSTWALTWMAALVGAFRLGRRSRRRTSEPGAS